MKKVIIKNAQDTINVNDCSEDKIYCSVCPAGHIFKLSIVNLTDNLDIDLYAFINLDSSKLWSNGDGTFIEILKRTLIQGNDLFEFNNINEFANWLNDRVN
jgi:hypothetical protein